jgi:hypothetical protein
MLRSLQNAQTSLAFHSLALSLLCYFAQYLGVFLWGCMIVFLGVCF